MDLFAWSLPHPDSMSRVTVPCPVVDKSLLSLLVMTDHDILSTAARPFLPCPFFVVTDTDFHGTAALALAASNAERNGCAESIEFVTADVQDYLADCIREKKTFDIVVLDPPKLAPSRCVLLPCTIYGISCVGNIAVLYPSKILPHGTACSSH